MPEPEVLQAMRRYRELLTQRDAVALRELARRWAQLERSIEAQVELLAEEAQRRAAAGETISRDMVRRWGRYERLQEQLRIEAGKYVNAATELIADEQRAQALLGLQHSAALVWALEPGALGAFDVLPVQALEYLVGLVGDGSPLRSYLAKVYPQAAEAMMDALVKGMGLGWGAERIARGMREAASVGLRTAMNTARTETLRVYRAASLAQYQASGMVEGYVRLAAKSTRTCAACLMTDGKFFPLSTPFEEHNQGRCSMLPALRGREAPQPQTTGREWFEEQAPAVQKKILGPGLFNAWKAGEIGLEDVPVLHEDLTWGNSWQVASVKQAKQRQGR